MLFRRQNRVYVALRIVFTAGMAAFLPVLGAEEPAKTPVVEADSVENVVETAVVKDVLGGDVTVPEDWTEAAPLRVVYLYEHLPPAALWQLERERGDAFRDARREELRTMRFDDDCSESEIAARLNAFAHALRHYEDPGPAVAVGVDPSPMPDDRLSGAFNRIDTNDNRSLVDEIRRDHWLDFAFLRLPDFATSLPDPKQAAAVKSSLYDTVRPHHGFPSRWMDQRPYHQWTIDFTGAMRGPAHAPSYPREPLELTGVTDDHPLADLVALYDHLLVIDGADKKQHLREIVDLTREMERLATEQNLPDALEAIDESESKHFRPLMAEVYYRRGRALAYMELPSVDTAALIPDQDAHDEAFEDAYIRLMGLASVREPQYALLTVRYYRRRGALGAALRLVQELSEDVERGSVRDYWLTKKRRDLFGELGWDAWRDYEHQWMWRKFPHWTYALEYGVD